MGAAVGVKSGVLPPFHAAELCFLPFRSVLFRSVPYLTFRFRSFPFLVPFRSFSFPRYDLNPCGAEPSSRSRQPNARPPSSRRGKRETNRRKTRPRQTTRTTARTTAKTSRETKTSVPPNQTLPPSPPPQPPARRWMGREPLRCWCVLILRTVDSMAPLPSPPSPLSEDARRDERRRSWRGWRERCPFLVKMESPSNSTGARSC